MRYLKIAGVSLLVLIYIVLLLIGVVLETAFYSFNFVLKGIDRGFSFNYAQDFQHEYANELVALVGDIKELVVDKYNEFKGGK